MLLDGVAREAVRPRSSPAWDWPCLPRAPAGPDSLAGWRVAGDGAAARRGQAEGERADGLRGGGPGPAAFHGQPASCGRHTGKARKTSSACSAWCSTPWCCGTPATSTPPSRVCGPPVTRSSVRTPPGCPSFGDKHVNMLGRYSSTAATRRPAPAARPVDPRQRSGRELRPPLIPARNSCPVLPRTPTVRSTWGARRPGRCRSPGRGARRRLDADQPTRLRLVSQVTSPSPPPGDRNETCWIRTFPGGVVALRSPG